MKLAVSSLVEDCLTPSLLQDCTMWLPLMISRGLVADVYTMGIVIQFARDTHVRSALFIEKWIDLFIDDEFYNNYTMYRETFTILLHHIGHKILKVQTTKPNYGGRPHVPLEKELLITLWYLAKGDSHISMSPRFNVAISTINHVTTRTVEHINKLAGVFIE